MFVALSFDLRIVSNLNESGMARIPEIYEGSPTDLWRHARQLSDEPDLEWTFPVFASRFLASQPLGFDMSYEELQSWDQAVGLSRQSEMFGEYLPPDFLSATWCSVCVSMIPFCDLKTADLTRPHSMSLIGEDIRLPLLA